MLTRKHSLKLERLENREMLTGDVIASFTGTTLHITEAVGHANEASCVAISQINANHIRVDGRNASFGNSPINGAAFLDILIPVGGMSIQTDLGGGNDRLRILPGTHLNSAILNLGGPGADVDTADINGLITTLGVNVSTGGGVDNISVQNCHIGTSGKGDLQINSGAGIDFVTVGNTSNYQTVAGTINIVTWGVQTENEADYVYADLNQSLNLFVNTGAGNDVINELANTTGFSTFVTAGDGNDTVTLRDCTSARDFTVFAGNGNDVVSMQYLRAINLTIDGGLGIDSLSRLYDGPVTNLAISGFETINGQPQFNHYISHP